MGKTFFRVIVPNYNNSKWLEKSLGSINKQTYSNWECLFVDDCSTDNSAEIAKNILDKNKSIIIQSERKLWNGGARNAGLEIKHDSEYTLFLDSDDWFVNNSVFEKLNKFIINNNYPDCVRLPYICRIGDQETPIMLNDSTAEKMVGSCFVACWTKCVRSSLIPKFPENTLMEDVVHHIAQCDVLDRVVPFTEPVIVWNRNNTNSCSRQENQNCQQGKWQSSMYRYMADLLELRLTHGYSLAERKKRADACLKNIKEDKYIQ